MITRVHYYRDFLHRKTVSSISPPFREAILQKLFLEILPFPPFSQMIVHMPGYQHMIENKNIRKLIPLFHQSENLS